MQPAALLNVIDCNTAYSLYPDLTTNDEVSCPVVGIRSQASALWKRDLDEVVAQLKTVTVNSQLGITGREKDDVAANAAVTAHRMKLEMGVSERMVGDIYCRSVSLGAPVQNGRTVVGQGWRNVVSRSTQNLVTSTAQAPTWNRQWTMRITFDVVFVTFGGTISYLSATTSSWIMPGRDIYSDDADSWVIPGSDSYSDDADPTTSEDGDATYPESDPSARSDSEAAVDKETEETPIEDLSEERERNEQGTVNPSSRYVRL